MEATTNNTSGKQKISEEQLYPLIFDLLVKNLKVSMDNSNKINIDGKVKASDDILNLFKTYKLDEK